MKIIETLHLTKSRPVPRVTTGKRVASGGFGEYRPLILYISTAEIDPV
jgi:hypothetical protein